jgi:aryl-alcohol dehydrogenase-like predicted oxidoreductase
VRAGLVRYVGVSNIPPDVVVEMQMIAERYGYEPIAVLQYRYNLLDRSVEKTGSNREVRRPSREEVGSTQGLES